MTAPIEVLRIHPLTGGGNVKAFIDLRLGGLTILGAKIVQQEGQRAWVGMPSQKSPDGKWRPIIVVDSKPLRERISETVLAAWQAPDGRPKPRGQQAWDSARAATAAPVKGEATEVFTSAEQPRQHVEELARRFEPDKEPPF
jgi:DNA-binding cell septation regulator SpoVG